MALTTLICFVYFLIFISDSSNLLFSTFVLSPDVFQKFGSWHTILYCSTLQIGSLLRCSFMSCNTHTDRKLEQRRRRVACVIRIHGNSISSLSSDVHEFLNLRNKSPISLCDDIFNFECVDWFDDDGPTSIHRSISIG